MAINAVTHFPSEVIAQNSLLLQFLPLLWGVALWCPSVDSRNLILKRSIHQPMSREHILVLEMGRNDNCHKSLSAATCIIAPQKSALTYIQYTSHDPIRSYPVCPNSDHRIPDKSSISTYGACNCSINLLRTDSAVTPDVESAMAASTAAKERAESEKGDFFWTWTGTGARRR